MAFVLEKALAFFLVIIAAFHVSTQAAVYQVGDSVGWTTVGNVDYNKWAETKTFRVGDIINFEYNKEFHNVIEVNHTEYRTCNTTAPIASYFTGNDSISIKKFGHYYFICGFLGHCQSGQKVDIRVVPIPSLAPTPTPPLVEAPPPPLVAAPPPKNTASLSSVGNLGKFAMYLLLISLI